MRLLTIKDLSVHLSNREVIKSADLKLEKGELLGLVGPNGAGKSTLLRAIVGLLPKSAGMVMLDTDDLQKIPADVRARRVAYLAQERTAHWPLLVERVVALGRFPHLAHWQQPTAEDGQIIEESIKATDIEHLRHRRFSNLSGGERMRVLLARALAVQAEVLLTDEPIAALDPAHAIAVMQVLRDYCDDTRAVITVMHDLTLAARFCHKLVLMNEGRIVAAGPPESVLTDKNLQHVYQVKPWTPDNDGHCVLPWTLSKPENPSS